MYYTGIGARETPTEVLELFTKIGKFLASRNITLRSGHAKGSDQAFENGCDIINGDKEIYLPWYRFEGSNSSLIVQDGLAFDIAEKHHPYWHNLSQGARKLQARNSHQVLGKDLNTPSDFVICWTKNGKSGGGTGQALRIAKEYNVPIFDVGGYDTVNDIDTVRRELKQFLIQCGVAV